ncbi:MAG TPA: 30S ribosomal protein S6 [Solirubrobacteraceae bacterium]|jgi:small subunit ribosomal protein S6|nr:30S ribosomal protein S6 [Solirubrobacteraceae bacterium]
MTLPAPTYDLMLLLDPEAEEGVRAKAIADTKASIGAKGELTRHDEWGERALAYPIRHRATAEYHLMQFHSGEAGLIGEVTRALQIAEGVLRVRVNKLKPGTPEAPDPKAERASIAREGAPAGASPREVEEPAAA